MKYTVCLLLFVMLSFTPTLYAQIEVEVEKKAEQDTILSTAESSYPHEQSITVEDLRKHLSILASDDFEGRETGTEGNLKAANYLADQFATMGLPAVGTDSTYFQPVHFRWLKWEKIKVDIDNKTYRQLWDFVALPDQNKSIPEFNVNEVIYLGYGIDDERYSDYRGKELKDKVILVYKGEPMTDGKSDLTGTDSLSNWSTDWRMKAKAARKHGVKLILVIENEIQKMISENRSSLLGPKMLLEKDQTNVDDLANTIYISSTMAKNLIGKQYKKWVKAREKMKRKQKTKPYKIKTDLHVVQSLKGRSLDGFNVLGYVEGSDPALKEELVVVTAHYDHLGKKGESIFNGADDNASGTSTIIEVAEAMAMAQQNGVGPKRSVLFMLVTGEEKGLLGSRFYVEYPIFELKNTIANVNVDMVGRIDQKYEELNNPNYVYVIGSDRLSTALHETNETVNKENEQLTLDYTYNAKTDPNRYYYRSDHYNFAERGIPAIFFFNGTHADYHRPSDTIEKIQFEKMEKIARHVYALTYELANRAERIQVDVFE